MTKTYVTHDVTKATTGDTLTFAVIMATDNVKLAKVTPTGDKLTIFAVMATTLL